MTCRPCLTIRRRPWLALLAVGACYAGAAHLDWRDHQATEARCSTDSECADLPECIADAACDGGPYPHPTTTNEDQKP